MSFFTPFKSKVKKLQKEQNTIFYGLYESEEAYFQNPSYKEKLDLHKKNYENFHNEYQHNEHKININEFGVLDFDNIDIKKLESLLIELIESEKKLSRDLVKLINNNFLIKNIKPDEEKKIIYTLLGHLLFPVLPTLYVLILGVLFFLMDRILPHLLKNYESLMSIFIFIFGAFLTRYFWYLFCIYNADKGYKDMKYILDKIDERKRIILDNKKIFNVIIYYYNLYNIEKFDFDEEGGNVGEFNFIKNHRNKTNEQIIREIFSFGDDYQIYRYSMIDDDEEEDTYQYDRNNDY